MLTPNKEISGPLGTARIKLESGEELSGVLSGRTETEWTVTLADGRERKIAPGQIGEHTLSSMMPPMGH